MMAFPVSWLSRLNCLVALPLAGQAAEIIP
jgi:hypothetical protein